MHFKEMKVISVTFIRIMFVTSAPGGFQRSHMNFISRVFPHPVSPITMTGMLHLSTSNIKQHAYCYVNYLHINQWYPAAKLELKKYMVLHRNPSQSYGASPAIWDYLSPDMPCLYPSQAGQYSLYLS